MASRRTRCAPSVRHHARRRRRDEHDIYELVVNLAAEGKALLYYSSETEEIAQLCHRVLVMREGRVISELSGAEASAEGLVAAALREGDR